MALSSAEAEFYASTKAAVEALGMESLMVDLGWKVAVKEVDLAGRGISKSVGFGFRRRWNEGRFGWRR